MGIAESFQLRLMMLFFSFQQTYPASSLPIIWEVGATFNNVTSKVKQQTHMPPKKCLSLTLRKKLESPSQISLTVADFQEF